MLLACVCLNAEARQTAEVEQAAVQIAALIDTSQPLFVEVRAGDLSSQLQYRLRQLLLEKGADLRELKLDDLDLSAEGGDAGSALPNLSSYALKTALLVDIAMELQWRTVETKSFLSYHSERVPLYSFEIKQIYLPQNRLARIDRVSVAATNNKAESQITRNLKWFEPVLATTALASIIYLLWTTE